MGRRHHQNIKHATETDYLNTNGQWFFENDEMNGQEITQCKYNLFLNCTMNHSLFDYTIQNKNT